MDMMPHANQTLLPGHHQLAICLEPLRFFLMRAVMAFTTGGRITLTDASQGFPS